MQRNTLKSFQWSFFTAIFRKAILFGVFLLVAKELTKEDLGIFREFSLVLAIFTSISFLGFQDLLIVKKERTKKIFHELFQFSFFISLISSVLLYLLAPYIGSYYNSPVLTDLLLKLSPLLVLEILRTSLRAYYQKSLRFKSLSIIETINVIVYSGLILIFLFYKLDIYSLVIIFYFGNLVELILLLIMDYKLSKETLSNLFSYKTFTSFLTSYKDNRRFLLTASLNNIVSMLINDLPVIILGILFDPILIGVYYLANQLIGQAVVLACNSLRQVLFPTFTFMSKQDIKFKIDKFLKITTIYAFPLFFLFVIYILNFVPIIFGDKWNEALPIVKILAFSLATTMLMNPISSIPYVLELPHTEMIYKIISLIVKSLAIYLGHFSGFQTALLYYVIASILMHLIFIGLVYKLLNGHITKTIMKLFAYSLPSVILIIIYYITPSFNIFLNLAGFSFLVGIYLFVIWKSNSLT